MAEEAAHVPDGTPEEDNDVQEKIDEVSADDDANTNTENLQTPLSAQDLANMFNNINLGEGQEGNMFVPVMQGMMQSLLAKVLYPSLKLLVDKYPAWLEENKEKIEESEYERFEKQQQLMEQFCNELEPDQESDSDDVKRKRFETVVELMQKMHELGQPPTDLVEEIGFPPQGIAAPTPDGSQCSIM